jgi:hypothetical protein
MNSKPVFHDLIKFLAEKGYTDDEIAETVSKITQAAFSSLYASAIASFSDDDIKAIEECPTDEDADAKIKELYKEHTGIDPDTKMQELLSTLAQDFLESLESESKNPQGSN